MAPVGANRHSVVIPTGSNSDAPSELSCSDSLRLLCGSAEFWVVMLLSVCLQTAREAFNTHSADLLATQGSSDAVSAALSAAFPLMGVPACGACREAVSFTLVRRMLAFDSSVLISAVLVWPQFSSGGLLTTTIVDETERSWRFR